MKKAKVLISVIIPTYNEGKNIGRLLASLAQQTFKDFKIIVVDNYSTDKTRQIASKFTNQVYQIGPERSAQRNFGLKKARGQYVLFLDADMTLEPKVLAECLKAIQRNQFSAVTIDEISKGASFFAKVKALEKQLIINQTYLEAPRFLRKKDLQKIGGFDETLISGEDWDLAQRIRKLDRIGKINAKIYHHETGSLLSSIKKKYYYAKYIQKYALKHPGVYKKQASILFRFSILFSKPKLILTSPVEFLGLLILKSAQYFAFLLAKKVK